MSEPITDQKQQPIRSLLLWTAEHPRGAPTLAGSLRGRPDTSLFLIEEESSAFHWKLTGAVMADGTEPEYFEALAEAQRSAEEHLLQWMQDTTEIFRGHSGTKDESPLMTTPHVDDFVSDMGFDDPPDIGQASYARWLLMHWRLPAYMKHSFGRFITDRTLFCTYQGRRYRCIGGSRLGDVQLTTEFTRDHGYDVRVSVAECSLWSDRPDPQSAIKPPTDGP